MYKNSQLQYLRFARANSLAFASLADAVLILYAIRAGADDFFVGLIVSFFYLTMPLMLFGRQSIAKQGAVKTLYNNWVLRNLSAFFLILVPWIQSYFSIHAGLIWFVLAAFGFFAFRSIGITCITPIIRDISSPENRGNFISKSSLQGSVFYLLAMVGIVFLTNRFQSISVFQVIVVFGSVSGMVSAIFIRKIDESDEPAVSAGLPLSDVIKFFKQNVTAKRLLVVWSMTTAGLVLVLPFSMISLKNGYQFSDHGALIFSVIQIFGGIVASYANTLLLDRVGPRPVIIIATFGLLLVCLMWILVPVHVILPILFIIFFIAGACNAAINTSLSHYLLGSMPAEYTVGISMFMTVISGAIAGIFGTILGGGVLKLFKSLGLTGLDIYRTYFILIAVFVAAAIFAASRLKPLADRRVKDVLGIMLSLRDWRALFTLQKLYEARSEQKDKRIISKLGAIRSNLSENSLIGFLESPSFITRAHAMRALGELSFGDKTEKILIKELEEGEHLNAFWAAEVLGDHKSKNAIPALRKALDSQDVFLRGKAMISLTKMNDKTSFEKIEQIFLNTGNPRLLVHGAKAFVHMRKPENLKCILDKVLNTTLAAPIRAELLYSASELAGAGFHFYKIYPYLKNDPDKAWSQLDELIAQLGPETEPMIQVIKTFKNIYVDSESHVSAELLHTLEEKIKCPYIPVIISFLAEKDSNKKYNMELGVTLILIIISCLKKFYKLPG